MPERENFRQAHRRSIRTIFVHSGIGCKDSESRAQRRGGKRSFSPRSLPRRILSYEKIVKAECKDEGKTEFFPEGFAEGILSYEKIGKAERKDEGKTEFFPEEFAEVHPAADRRGILFADLETKRNDQSDGAPKDLLAGRGAGLPGRIGGEYLRRSLEKPLGKGRQDSSDGGIMPGWRKWAISG